MSSHHGITRRTILLASPAIAITGMLPIVFDAEASAPADDELHKLFAAWREVYDLASAGDTDCDAQCERLWAIEERMAELRPVTLLGFAIKFLVMTAYDEFDLDSARAKTLFADAIAITAVPPPASFSPSLNPIQKAV